MQGVQQTECGHYGCRCANASSTLPSLPAQAPWSQSARYSRCLRACVYVLAHHVMIHQNNEWQCVAVSVPRRLSGMLSSRRCMATPNGRRHRWISSISILHIPWQIHYKANRAAQRTDLHIILHTQLQIVRSRGLNPIRVRSWWWTGCLWRKASFVSDNLTIAHLYYTRTRTHTNTQSTLGERCCEEGSNCVKLLCDYNAVLTSAHMKREIIYWYSTESQQIMSKLLN